MALRAEMRSGVSLVSATGRSACQSFPKTGISSSARVRGKCSQRHTWGVHWCFRKGGALENSLRSFCDSSRFPRPGPRDPGGGRGFHFVSC